MPLSVRVGNLRDSALGGLEQHFKAEEELGKLKEAHSWNSIGFLILISLQKIMRLLVLGRNCQYMCVPRGNCISTREGEL